MSVLAPTEIRVHTRARILDLAYADGRCYSLPAEYLRVHSPSAEVQGHGVEPPVLVTGKENVGISSVEPVGHYAVRLMFDDGHNTGLYTWKYLYELGQSQHSRWAEYLRRVEKERPGKSPAKS